MLDAEREFWITQRAALIKRALALQEERAALLEQVAAIERAYGLKPHATRTERYPAPITLVED